MIMITGATGPFGNAAIQFLIKKGIDPKQLACLARDKEKAAMLASSGVQVRFGNYDNYKSLVIAFQGIEKLLMVSGSEVEKRDRQHENIVNAAKQAEIKHVVYTSFFRKSDNLDSPIAAIAKTHIETENMLMKSGLHYTLMRNALYADVLPMFVGQNVLESGIWLPAGDGRVPFASRMDMAEAAATVVSEEGHTDKAYRIVNTENYSFSDIADMLSEVTGKKITYSSPSDDDYVKMLTAAGVPVNAVHGALSWAKGIRQHYFESDGSDMEMLVGRKPEDLRSILARMYQDI